MIQALAHSFPIDLSIIPGNVSANTYNTVIAIGEKAAVLLAQDLGIKGVSESD
jgi:alcohol oxidase